jgi:predicted negative regulator of RcsB-dependent stress response
MDLLEKQLAEKQTTNVPVQAVKNETAALEHEVAMLKQRFKWVAVLWWILFIMVVLGAFALVSWNMWDTWKLREESMMYGARVEKRIDDTAQNSQRNLQDRSLTVEQRLDNLMRDFSDLKAEMKALEINFERAEQICTNACNAAQK